MKTKSVDINLSLEVINEEVMANVRFCNESDNIVYLDSWTLCMDDVFRGSVFSIAYDNDMRAMYSGMMVNRLVLPEHFIELGTGESINALITINKGYKLVKGKKYSIRFCAINPACPGKQQSMELWSNKVEIVY